MMNFTFTWIMDKLGYMPKIDMQVGKINEAPWPFPAPKVSEDFEPRPKRKPSLKKATTRTKAVVKKTVKKAK
jgi:hypothetical protein